MAQTLLLRTILAAVGTFVLFVTIIFLPFAGLPMAAIGLAYGVTQAALVALVSMLLIAGLLTPSLAIAFGFLFAAPILVAIRQALLSRPDEDGRGFEFYPLDRLILLVIGLCGVGTIGAFTLLGGANGLPQAFANALAATPEVNQALGQLYQLSDPEDMLQMAKIILITGFASWPLLILGNLQIAQILLVRVGLNLRPAGLYQTLTLPSWLGFILSGTLIIALATSGWVSTLAGSLSAMAMAAYFLLGLAIIHAISRHWNGRGFFLAALYFLIFFMAWVILPIALMGLLDARFDFRKLNQHPDKPTDKHGDEE